MLCFFLISGCQPEQTCLRCLYVSALFFSSSLAFNFELSTVNLLSLGSFLPEALDLCSPLSPLESAPTKNEPASPLESAPTKCGGHPLKPRIRQRTKSFPCHSYGPSASSLSATLARSVTHKSFACHSYRKHRGWGIPLVFSAPPANSALKSTRAKSTSICLAPLRTHILIRNVQTCQPSNVPTAPRETCSHIQTRGVYAHKGGPLARNTRLSSLAAFQIIGGVCS